jgi:invasion protein IalB
MLHRVTFIPLIALAGLLSAPAASGQTELPALIYSPWAKTCIGETCFIGKGVRTECALIVGIALIENAKDTKKILGVTLPTSVNTDRGVRIAVDQAQPIVRPFERCYVLGCNANYEAGAELVEQLKQGRTLTIEAVDTANSSISLSLPLAGFAAAYDGPAQTPAMPLFEAQPGQLEKELRAQQEPQKHAEDDRKARCEEN